MEINCRYLQRMEIGASKTALDGSKNYGCFLELYMQKTDL